MTDVENQVLSINSSVTVSAILLCRWTRLHWPVLFILTVHCNSICYHIAEYCSQWLMSLRVTACSITNTPTTLNFVSPWLPTTRRDVCLFSRYGGCHTPSRRHSSLELPLSYTLSPVLCSSRWRRTTSRRWDEGSGRCFGPASDIWEAGHGGGVIVPLSGTSHSTHTPLIVNVNTGAQPDTDEAGLLQFTASRLILAVSIHYSACRTTPLGLFCKHRSGATQTRCCASSTGCLFVTESSTSWLWWLTRSAALLHRHISVVTSNLANQHEHYVHLTLRYLPYLSSGLSSQGMLFYSQLHLSETHYLHSSPTGTLWRPSNLGWKLDCSVHVWPHCIPASASKVATLLRFKN